MSSKILKKYPTREFFLTWKNKFNPHMFGPSYSKKNSQKSYILIKENGRPFQKNEKTSWEGCLSVSVGTERLLREQQNTELSKI